MPDASSPEKFWANATRLDDCLIFRGKGRAGAYGRVGYGGKLWLAHRLAYYITHGVVPLEVRHTCDVPLCIEPTHLIDGTHTENMADMVAKGRQERGEQRSNHVLTEANVVEIKRAHADKSESNRALARRFGVSNQHIGKIVRGAKWKGTV